MGNRVIKNAAWIIGCKIVQSMLTIIITVISARYLGPENFGLVNYAASLAAFAFPVMKLGLDGILVRELVREPEQENEIMGTAVLMNLVSSFLCIFGIVSFAALTNAGERETLIVCALYSLVLIAQAFEMLQYWFQARLLSKYSSIAVLLASFFVSLYKIYLLVSGKSIYWFAVSNALNVVFADIVFFIVYRRFAPGKLSFSGERARKMISVSRYYIISDLMVVVFAQTDRVMLKMMIGDAATGYYSAAVMIAGFSSFVVSALIDSARPSILESKQSDPRSYQRKTTQLYSVIIYFAMSQSAVIAVFAPLIVNILYGPAYSPAVSALRIIVWYTTFSYLGAVRNVWILAEGKQKILWRVNASGALANVLLNALMIPVWGVDGAALASLITQIFTDVISCFIFSELRPTLPIMLKSLDPRVCTQLVKKLVPRKQ